MLLALIYACARFASVLGPARFASVFCRAQNAWQLNNFTPALLVGVQKVKRARGFGFLSFSACYEKYFNDL